MNAGSVQEGDMNGTTVHTTGTGGITVEGILKEIIMQWKEDKITSENSHLSATAEKVSPGMIINKTKKLYLDIWIKIQGEPKLR